MFWRLINKELCTYREVFIDDIYDFHDVFKMHEYCDRLDYDQAIQNYESDKEMEKNRKWNWWTFLSKSA